MRWNEALTFFLTPHLDHGVLHLGVQYRNYVGGLMQRGGGNHFDRQHILPRKMEDAL